MMLMIQPKRFRVVLSFKKMSTIFFSYQFGIIVDNQPIDILPFILDFINRGQLLSMETITDSEVVLLPIKPANTFKSLWAD